MFRPKIKVLDCTVRDGGLINNHDFDAKYLQKINRSVLVYSKQFSPS